LFPLSRSLYKDFDCFNYDSVEDRLLLKKANWNRESPLVIFDEIHKMPNWKKWLKGIYDKEGVRPRMLVTESACLDS
jgi:predicted AAA+ superfamily ATPase